MRVKGKEGGDNREIMGLCILGEMAGFTLASMTIETFK